MKKLLVLALMCIMMLSGCGADPYATVSDPDDPVLSVDDTVFTKEQFYDAMISSDSATLVNTKLIDLIYQNIIGDTTTIDEQAQATVDSFKENTGDYFLVYLYYYGYSSEAEYYSDLVLYLEQNAIANKYIEDNYDALVTEYAPKMVRILQTSSQDDANTALEAIKNGADFYETAQEYGNGNYTGEEQLVYNASTDVSDNVLLAINSYTEAGLMDAVVVNSEGTLFNVIEITDVDANNFVDEFTDTLLNDIDITSTAIAYYAVQGNFTVYDEDVYAAMQESYPDYLNQ